MLVIFFVFSSLIINEFIIITIKYMSQFFVFLFFQLKNPIY